MVVACRASKTRFAGRAACFAHGDFCPVNVLLEAGDWGLEARQAPPLVVGLLDLEFARVADPLFDVAWWGWVVRFHHPERWVHAFPRLLQAAGIPDDPETRGRIGVLQRLRCLEVVDYHQRTGRAETAAMWAERLHATLAWE